MDSVDGIRLWWLQDGGLMSRSVLEDILEELVETKWMVAVGDSATRVYALNAGQAEAIAAFVQCDRGERRG